jgi:purine-binding chemotaxis protein CheW
MKWITFCVEDEDYCHQVSSVKEVLRYEEPVPVPGAPSFVAGIINVRGEVMVVLDTRVIMDLPPFEMSDASRIICLELPEGNFGLLVDSVSEMIDFEDSQLDQGAQPTSSAGSTVMIKGTYKDEKGLKIAIDVDTFVANYIEERNAAMSV